MANEMRLPWSIYRCKFAETDRSANTKEGIPLSCCGIKDTDGDFVIQDTNSQECYHSILITDAEYIIEKCNG